MVPCAEKEDVSFWWYFFLGGGFDRKEKKKGGADDWLAIDVSRATSLAILFVVLVPGERVLWIVLVF